MDEPLSAYIKTDILGKSQLELVIQVYDGAIGALKSARQACETKDKEKAFQQLERAKRFVTHLYTTLDKDRGGEIADQLSRLYAFVINQTNVIEATKDLKLIDDNINILNSLRLGWQGLKEQQDNEKRRDEGASLNREESLTTLA